MPMPCFARAGLMAGALLGLLGGCASTVPAASPQTIALLERVSWGVNAGSLRQVQAQGWERYLDGQLQPRPAPLPAPVQARIDAMRIGTPLEQLMREMAQQRESANALAEPDARKLAQQAYRAELNRLAREAATRSLLLALHSPNQLQQQMTWFWMNHFSVFQGKKDLRAMVGDYEARAIAPHALGKFRDLLGASAHHPAMLRYLDNDANGVKRLNENYARELMELHTLGVDGGYSQRDVQELARILTGVGVNAGAAPGLAPPPQERYVRRGLFEFNPKRHDYGDKQFLGQRVRGRGLAELDEALDLLSRSPATARFICRKLAQFLVADAPPPALVERMAQTFLRSDGDIAATLRPLFASAELRASLGQKFKDPLHYVLSALRLSYDERLILNAGPLLDWLARMGQPLYGRPTPDGYALAASAWASPGQMSARFEIARAIGSGSAALFAPEPPPAGAQPVLPQLASALYFSSIRPTLGPATLQAMAQAGSPQEWNTFLLASPEMMQR